MIKEIYEFTKFSVRFAAWLAKDALLTLIQQPLFVLTFGIVMFIFFIVLGAWQ